MEKPNRLKPLLAILGFVGFAIPAFGIKNNLAMWVFGAYHYQNEFQMIDFGNGEIFDDNPGIL
nr:hypothetical protein [Candidatus Sigynarchaeum springense]